MRQYPDLERLEIFRSFFFSHDAEPEGVSSRLELECYLMVICGSGRPLSFSPHDFECIKRLAAREVRDCVAYAYGRCIPVLYLNVFRAYDRLPFFMKGYALAGVPCLDVRDDKITFDAVYRLDSGRNE